MPCAIIDSIESLYTAYRDLIARCCPDTTPISPEQCVVPSMLTLYNTVQEMVSSESCGTLTASEDAPDPGQLPPCLNGGWLASCKAWIEGLNCTPTGICEPEETCISCTGVGPDFQMTGSLNEGVFYGDPSPLAAIKTRWNESLQKWEGVIVINYPPGYEGNEYIWTSNATERCSPVGNYINPGSPPPAWTFNDYDVEGFCL